MSGFYPTTDTGIDHRLDADPREDADPDPRQPSARDAALDEYEERERAALEARSKG